MGHSTKLPALAAILAAGILAGCSQVIPPHLLPLPAQAKALLAKKDMREDAPIFVRIFKQESELEVWKAKADGRYYHFKTYPICTFSGSLGPKFMEGDLQSPEGFYKVAARQMNPKSQFHLSFNLGFPNAYDRANGRTGTFLMVHGDCKSIGCYAMTDVLIEEIYALAREAFAGGQKAFDVQAFPFRMTPANMKKFRRHEAYNFWRNNLLQGYRAFEETQLPPKVDFCEKRYVINANFVNGPPANAAAACPKYEPLMVKAMPRAPISRAAGAGAPGTNVANRPATSAASQATIGGGGMFGFAPATPSVAGFAFRANSRLSR